MAWSPFYRICIHAQAFWLMSHLWTVDMERKRMICDQKDLLLSYCVFFLFFQKQKVLGAGRPTLLGSELLSSWSFSGTKVELDLWVKRRSSRGNLRTSHLPPRKLNKVPLNGWSLEKMCACKPVGVCSLCSLYLPSLDINFHSCSVYLSWFETSRDMKTLVISLLVTYDVHVLILNCNWGSYMDKLSFHLLSSLKGLGNFPSMQLSYVSFYQACDF